MLTKLTHVTRQFAVTPLLLVLVFGLVGACGSEREDESPFPDKLGCSKCTDQQVCWFTYGYDGDVSRSGCLELPTECSGDASCDCLRTGAVCDQVGWPPGGCRIIEDVRIVECISTLG
jgi:hypothetical protein